jgi:voltage-gated potassium channel
VANFSTVIGMSGVFDEENHRARRFGTYFEVPMILLAIGVVILWYLERQNVVNQQFVWICDLIILLFFILETLVLTALVDDKKRHLKNNWMNLLIIIMGLPIVFEVSTLAPILRSFRLLLLFPLFINMFATVQRFLAKNNLGVTLLVSLALVIIVGLFISAVDPSIENASDGLWWAWVTVTTVGYGDVVPTSYWGRAIGAVLILIGFVLFSLLTASISAFLIVKDEEELVNNEVLMLTKLDQISTRLSAIETRLNITEPSNHPNLTPNQGNDKP